MTQPAPTPEAPKPPVEPVVEPPATPPVEEKAPPAQAKPEIDWKIEARKWEDRAKENKTAAEELATIKAAQMTAEQKAQADLETANKRTAALLDRTVKAEVRALASEAFADPGDAHLYLDLAKYVSTDGEVDGDAIKADLAALVAAKPHLVKAGRPAADIDQGTRGGGTAVPAQLTQADLTRMTPAEIVKAQAEGRCNDLLGVKR